MSIDGIEGQWGRVDGGRTPPRRPRSPSLVPRRLCHRSGGCGVIVERVIEKSSIEIVFPTLTRTNYAE
jgi:hypothetical protein